MDWDNARRVREPIAWILLIIATVGIAMGLWTLAGLPGGPYSGDNAILGSRALLAENYFSNVYPALLPIIAVLLVTFAGGLTRRAGQLITAAAGVQALAVGLAVISLVMAAQGGSQPVGPPAPAGETVTTQISAWTYVGAGSGIALVAAGLILSLAILRSPAVRAVAGSLPAARRP
jgi:hypothetical protein